MPKGVYLRTEQNKNNNSKAKKGLMPWNKGKKGVQLVSDKTKKKLSLAQTGNKNRLGKIPWNKNKTSLEDKRILSGKKCHFWKGGIAKDRRTGGQYKKWRSNVFTRDNWTCQTCGKRGCYLEAHHIKSWAKYPKLRHNIDNGVTLCKECHKLTDNYKWKNIFFMRQQPRRK